MSSRNTLRPLQCSLLAALALTTSSAFANPNVAAGTPNQSFELPAGYACANFPLKVETWDGKGEYREVKSRNGYTRFAFAGTGAAWRLTNLGSGKSMTTQNNGASALIQINEVDGSVKYKIQGHSLLIWFPTDMPKGPSTTLNSGQVSFHVDAIGTGSMLSTEGKTTDVCATLK